MLLSRTGVVADIMAGRVGSGEKPYNTGFCAGCGARSDCSKCGAYGPCNVQYSPGATSEQHAMKNTRCADWLCNTKWILLINPVLHLLFKTAWLLSLVCIIRKISLLASITPIHPMLFRGRYAGHCACEAMNSCAPCRAIDSQP